MWKCTVDNIGLSGVVVSGCSWSGRDQPYHLPRRPPENPPQPRHQHRSEERTVPVQLRRVQ